MIEVAAVGQRHAFAQAAVAAETVQHARHGAGVLAQFAGLALEAVNLLDDLDRQQDVVVLELNSELGSCSRTLVSRM